MFMLFIRNNLSLLLLRFLFGSLRELTIRQIFHDPYCISYLRYHKIDLPHLSVPFWIWTRRDAWTPSPSSRFPETGKSPRLVSPKQVNLIRTAVKLTALRITFTSVNILGVLSSDVEQGVLAVGNHGAPDVRDLGARFNRKNLAWVLAWKMAWVLPWYSLH